VAAVLARVRQAVLVVQADVHHVVTHLAEDHDDVGVLLSFLISGFITQTVA